MNKNPLNNHFQYCQASVEDGSAGSKSRCSGLRYLSIIMFNKLY